MAVANPKCAILLLQSSEEWKSSTKRETYTLLEQELGRLLATAPAEKKVALKGHNILTRLQDYWCKEFENFKALFARFLRAKTTIDWKWVFDNWGKGVMEMPKKMQENPAPSRGLHNSLFEFGTGA